MVRILILILLSVCMVSSVSAAGKRKKKKRNPTINYDTYVQQGYWSSPEEKVDNDRYRLEIDSWANYKFNKNLQIRWHGMIDHTVGQVVFDESPQLNEEDQVFSPTHFLNLPGNYLFHVGSEYFNKIYFAADLVYHHLYDNRWVEPAWSNSTLDAYVYGMMRHKYRYGALLYTELDLNNFRPSYKPLRRMKMDVEALYHVAPFDYQYKVGGDPVVLSGLVDKDLWLRSNFYWALDRKKAWAIRAQLLHKNELDSDSDLYNSTNIHVGMETSLKLFKRTFRLYGDMFMRYYTSELLDIRKGNELLENTGFNGHLRINQKIGKTFLVKGDLMWDFSLSQLKNIADKNKDSGLRMLRYELAGKYFMYSQPKNYLEGGFWAVGGVLFPRSCLYLTGSMEIMKGLAFIPKTRFYWRYGDQRITNKIGNSLVGDRAYRFYRSDFNTTFRYHIPSSKINMNIFLGGEYKYYKYFGDKYTGETALDYRSMNFYPTQFNIFLGIANWEA